MKIKNYLAMFIAIAGLVFASCGDDNNGPSYDPNGVEVANADLKKVLEEKGFNFNEKGNLLQDEKVQNTTTLDLSGTNLSEDALAGLTVLPKLNEVNLSNNGYGPVFDFSKLPAQITGVDLRGNELYDFEGLVDVKMENDERQTTVLHNLKKLYLPETAKYNVEDLMPYYETAGETTDMQMVNKDNTLEKYNTLREIPDEYFRAYLKTVFPSLFVTDNQIDISKPQSVNEQGQNLMLGLMTQVEDLDKVSSVEGVEYFINNPFYKSFMVALNPTKKVSVKYLCPKGNIKALILYNTDTTEKIDLSKATGLSLFAISNNSKIKTLDLSNTLIANQDYTKFDVLVGNGISVSSCENLSEIKLNENGVGITSDVEFSNLPKLTNLDISNFVGLQSLTLQSLPNCSIKYPIDKLKYRYHASKEKIYEIPGRYTIRFTISDDVKNMNSTQEFINKFGKGLKVENENL